MEGGLSKSGVGGPPKPPASQVKQDGGRPGGYKPLDYTRRVGTGQPKRALWWVGGFFVMQYFAWTKRLEIQQEYMQARDEYQEMRHYIRPYLQAEEDRILRILRDRRIERERELMHDVKGWSYDDNVYLTRGAGYISMSNSFSYADLDLDIN